MDLKELDILGEKIHEHWYYVSKGRALRDFLNGLTVDEVLDIGAGSGIFSRQLIDNDIAQSAVCIDPNYAEEKKENWNGKTIKFLKSLERTTQSLILMMDVLEHVPDDVALIKEYTNSMPTGGKVLITVPAFQFMWSGHDVFLEHYRRYSIPMVEECVKNAGLHVIKSRYFFATLFPAVAIIRQFKNFLMKKRVLEAKSELGDHPQWLNIALTKVHTIERKILFPINKLLGLSVFCLCEKD